MLKKAIEKLKNNTFSDDELVICLKSESRIAAVLAMSRLIERNIYFDVARVRLEELSHLLTGNKYIGPWQIGHFAIAALSLLDDKNYQESFNNIYSTLSENDKFLVNNFIYAEAYKL